MLKKYLCGVAIVAAMSASAPTSAHAEELFVRNRAFAEAYFVGGTTYVPVDTFLKALEVPWSVKGATIVLGEGNSPDNTFATDTAKVMKNGKTLDLAGMLRGGRLFVPAKDLATFVGYAVIHNADTGIVDVVKTREINAADREAAKEVQAANQAERDALKAEREARVAKEKAFLDAKTKKEGDKVEAEGEGDVAVETTTKVETTTTTAQDDPTTAKVETTTTKVETTTVTEEPKEPPKAELVVLTTDSDPQNYEGQVTFRAVLQNQGYAAAKDVTAKLTVVGPDGLTWVDKTIYHGPIPPDGRWEIVELYKHRLGASMPRGAYSVTVTPKFTSAPPAP